MANPNPMEGAQEIQSMLVSYAKQETIEPLKTLGKFLAWGIGGAVLVSLGALFVSLGILRLLQTETSDWFAGGNFASTLPYVITIASLILMIVVIFILFTRAKKKVLS
jgi:hypothetical protein